MPLNLDPLPDDDPVFSGSWISLVNDPLKSTDATSRDRKRKKTDEQEANDEGTSVPQEDPNSID